jgi:hypothetical protein
MTATSHRSSDEHQKRQPNLWPWAITLLVALLLSLRVPQEQDRS